MDKSHTMEVAATIWQQLKDFTDYSVLWSWGIHNIRAAVIDSRAGLAFDVEGFMFKGTVVVILDDKIKFVLRAFVPNGHLPSY